MASFACFQRLILQTFFAVLLFFGPANLCFGDDSPSEKAKGKSKETVEAAAPQLADKPNPNKKLIPGKGPAYTAPPKDDPNYHLMGEFIGEIQTSEEKMETLGLQIRPIGGDQFDAVSFIGGLPGQDKHNPQPIRMIGKRSDDFVVLSGGPWAIFVEKNSCMLLNRQGNKIGRLKRLQRTSSTMHATAPEGAMVLFDGSNVNHFSRAKMTKQGLLMEGADVKPMFQDFNLHIEFRLPYMPEAEGQSRANSGLYLQSRYECQVLDSFAQDPQYNGCGSLYKTKAPDLNMCFPPLVWQTYDVQFTAPRWAADGSKIRNAHITSWINGVKVQDNVSLPNKTGAGQEEQPTLLPSKFQDHGDPVRYRNAWIVDRGLTSGEFPIRPTAEELETRVKAEQAKREAAKKAAEKRREERQAKAAAEKKAKADAEQKAKAMKQKAKNPEKSSQDSDANNDSENAELPENASQEPEEKGLLGELDLKQAKPESISGFFFGAVGILPASLVA